METNFKSRRLSASEKAFSKTLTFPLLRKEFIMRLNAGEKFENIEEEFKHRLNEAQNAQKQAEIEEKEHKEHDENILLAIKEAQKDPMDMELLEKALQVPYTTDVWEKQMKYLCNLFVQNKTAEEAAFQHALGYKFLDQAAEKHNFFNGLALEFIFMGGHFSSSSWILLTKHRKLIIQLGLHGRATHLLKNMFYTLCRKEGLLPPRKEYEAHEADMMRLVTELFEKSLTRGLYTEEKSILNVYNLLQVFA